MFKVLKSNLILALLSVGSLVARADDGSGSEFSALPPDSTRGTGEGVRLVLENDSSRTDFLGSVQFSGEVRLFAIYRNMQDPFFGQDGNDQDLQFVSYPQTTATQTSNAAVPLINLNLSARPTARTEFNIGYSMNHDFSGGLGDASKDMTVRSNLNFGGKFKTDLGAFAIQAGGGILWTNLSPMTMSNIEYYRIDQFDRLPWDWYTQNWKKYSGLYENGMAMGGESYGDVAFQGLKVAAQGLPEGFSVLAMLGRTNFSVDQEGVFNKAPYLLGAGRVDKIIGDHVVGVNLYNQWGYVNSAYDSLDLRRIVSVDGRLDFRNIKIFGEVGIGTIKNPAYLGSDSLPTAFDNDNGFAFISKVDISENMFGLPLTVQLYSIDHNVVSNVSSVMNSNFYTPAGGFNKEQKYNGNLFMNVMQEVGQLANNRNGLAIRTNKFINKLGIEAGFAISQEKEAIYDSVTIYHRANTFSRSRFVPWVQDAGYYGRVRNNFRRAFELLPITNRGGGKIGFSAYDLVLKYKFDLGGDKHKKSLIIKNYLNYNTTQKGIMPNFGDEAYVRMMYDQFIAFLKITNRVTLIGMAEFETVKGSTDLATANDDGEMNIAPLNSDGEIQAVYAPEGNPIDQLGQGYGIGIDYDFSNFAGIYIRHRWMNHEDSGFYYDSFKGQETTVELKIFF